MDESTYDIVCRHVESILDLEQPERQRFLDRLQRENASIAAAVVRLMQGDADADAARFLELDPQLTPTRLHPPAPDLLGASLTPLPESIAGYDVIEKLGEGGMGAVYRVFQRDADREVALKVVHPGVLADPAQLVRFRNEAKSAASMQHDHIVPVYDVGEHDSVPYFTMAVVEGQSLQDRLLQHSMSPHEAAELVQVLAGAIQYAHDRGIVHRDLKPGNILIDEVGKPWVTDFGIAKRLNDDTGQTQTGQIIGTAAYIAPEQIDRHDLVGPRSDVYGLGAILYHCLTGSPPFQGHDIVRTLSEVRSRLPRHPRDVNADIDKDLASICMRCLQKEPDERYTTASALAEDLDRFLKGEPLGDAGSSWVRSLVKALKYRDRNEDFLSAGAARWTLVVTTAMHLAVFAVIMTNQSHLWLWATLAIGTVGHGIVSYRYHWAQYWQLMVMERQSGVIQFSVSLAFACLFLIHGPLSVNEPVSQFLGVYAPLTVVVGVATFAHAGAYSGKWLLSGALCFPLSLLISQFPNLGPLLLSAMSAVILVQVDVELRRSISNSRKQ